MKDLKVYWGMVFTAILLLVLGVLYGLEGSTWKAWGLLCAMGISILLVLSSFLIHYLAHTEAVINELKALIKIFNAVYLSILSDEELMEFEKNANEVWVMTPDLYYELNAPDWMKLIYKNIENEKNYTYFIREELEPRYKLHLKKIQQYLKTKDKTLGQNQINKIFVDSIIPTEVVLYDPISDRPNGFVVSPVEGSKINMRMDDSVMQKVVALLNSYIKKEIRK